jgi:hypothetical protein
MSVKIIICTRCEGLGYRTERITTDYHRGEYAVVKHACRPCDSRGRLMQTTTVTYSKLEPYP